MKIGNAIIGMYFVILSPLAHADISYVDRDNVLSALANNINRNYSAY